MGIVNNFAEKSVFLPAKENELVLTVDQKQYPARRGSLIVLSGGMDSVTLMHEYKASIALAVTFDYGSHHHAREIECARRQCELH